jgi:hypothetical protein
MCISFRTFYDLGRGFEAGAASEQKKRERVAGVAEGARASGRFSRGDMRHMRAICPERAIHAVCVSARSRASRASDRPNLRLDQDLKSERNLSTDRRLGALENSEENRFRRSWTERRKNGLQSPILALESPGLLS